MIGKETNPLAESGVNSSEKSPEAGKTRNSRLAPAKRELERQSVLAVEGQPSFATAHAPGRAASTFVALGKNPLGVLT